MKRLYFDSSAYLHLLLDEEAAAALRADTVGAELLSSVLLVLETNRNLIRLARERALAADHYAAALEQLAIDESRFVFRDLTLDLCDAHPLPALATPRSLDLVHLRTALWFHALAPIDRFVTLDAAQETAARELGLPV